MVKSLTIDRLVMRMVRSAFLLLLTFFILVFDSLADPQKGRIWTGPSDGGEPRWAKASDFDGSFIFCRGWYQQNHQTKDVWGWYVDYPGADNNILVRLSELTTTKIRLDYEGYPLHVVVKLDSPLLFKCPMLFISDAGLIELKGSEIDNLKKYFEKGGFLWLDDFWGTEEWKHWESQIRKVLPADQYPMIDIEPTHPIMNILFNISKIPQVPNILLWNQTGQTSEQGEDSKDVHFRGITDKQGQLIAVMTHNTDIGETWEREGVSDEFFYKFSPIGYEIGINIFLYALTH